MAVLESATKRPMKSASRNDTFSVNASTTATTAAVPAICSAPAERMVRQICRMAVSEKSSPTVKSSRTMPTSASISTSWGVLITRMPLGPATTPAIINATMPGTRRRASVTTRARAMA